MVPTLTIDAAQVERCRTAARAIADGIQGHIQGNTTVSVERTVARLLGIDGVDGQGVPLPNVVVDRLHGSATRARPARDDRTTQTLAAGAPAGPPPPLEASPLGRGLSYWIGNALAQPGTAQRSPQALAEAIGRGDLDLLALPQLPAAQALAALEPSVTAGIGRLRAARERRAELQQRLPPGPQPWLYVIVATGNIHEDVVQARAAARQGADIIAVIRSTAQSLLDYVPFGATTEGFGGTFATQENFRIMRAALDEVSAELGRYVQLVNYCSGLCMPEIAAAGAMERLDMMLNDSMYGILFRDINMRRTFVDQYFSRMINAYAGIIINTGEDNYLTTADAVAAAHTVLASQFINEELARRSGLPERQMGLGHAFEIDPDLEDGFLLELAHAQTARQIFPAAPLKYMPPTKHMTGNVFKGHLLDGLFNLAGIMTGQSIQLLGILTEAIHTPFLHDRALAIENARYVFGSARHLAEEIRFAPEGRIQERSRRLVSEACALLEQVAAEGLMAAIAAGRFADIARQPDGGKGLAGVVPKDAAYANPFMDRLRAELGV